MEMGKILVLLTILLLVVAMYTTQTMFLLKYQIYLKKYKIKPSHKVEPVIFEPQKKIRLSRSMYKVNSYTDFKPYKETFKQFGYYMVRFLKDIHDPQYSII